MFNKNNSNKRPVISFELKREKLDYVIIIKNTGNTDGIVNSIKLHYNTLPLMIKPKLKAKIEKVIPPQEEVTIDMPSVLGTNFIEALSKFDFSYAMPKLILYYSDYKKNKYKVEFFFVGNEDI